MLTGARDRLIRPPNALEMFVDVGAGGREDSTPHPTLVLGSAKEVPPGLSLGRTARGLLSPRVSCRETWCSMRRVAAASDNRQNLLFLVRSDASPLHYPYLWALHVRFQHQRGQWRT